MIQCHTSLKKTSLNNPVEYFDTNDNNSYYFYNYTDQNHNYVDTEQIDENSRNLALEEKLPDTNPRGQSYSTLSMRSVTVSLIQTTISYDSFEPRT